MFQLEGKVVKICEQITGVSQTTGNPWSSQTFVIMFGDRERHAAFTVFNKILNIKEEDQVIVDFTPGARENQTSGRWYTSLYVDDLSIVENRTVSGMTRDTAPKDAHTHPQEPQSYHHQHTPKPQQQSAQKNDDNLPF